MSKLIVLSKQLHAYMDGTFLLPGSLSHQFLINSDILGGGVWLPGGTRFENGILLWRNRNKKQTPQKKEFVIKINYNEPE